MSRILVPLDGSSFAEAALPVALAIARRGRGEIRLLSVQEGTWTGRAREAALRWRADYLRRADLGVHGRDVLVDHAVREGIAEHAILSEADAWDADLIVMATHGRGAISTNWLGGVSDHCLRHAQIPLLLVHPRPSEARGADRAFLPSRLVVPVDGSEGSTKAIEAAASLAILLSVPLELVRVAAPTEDEATVREWLECDAALLRARGIDAFVRVLAGEAPATAILEDAGIEPIVISTHGAPTDAPTLLGSVADKVVRGARGAVLVVPAQGRALTALSARVPSSRPESAYLALYDDHGVA